MRRPNSSALVVGLCLLVVSAQYLLSPVDSREGDYLPGYPGLLETRPEVMAPESGPVAPLARLMQWAPPSSGPARRIGFILLHAAAALLLALVLGALGCGAAVQGAAALLYACHPGVLMAYGISPDPATGLGTVLALGAVRLYLHRSTSPGAAVWGAAGCLALFVLALACNPLTSLLVFFIPFDLRSPGAVRPRGLFAALAVLAAAGFLVAHIRGLDAAVTTLWELARGFLPAPFPPGDLPAHYLERPPLALFALLGSALLAATSEFCRRRRLGIPALAAVLLIVAIQTIATGRIVAGSRGEGWHRYLARAGGEAFVYRAVRHQAWKGGHPLFDPGLDLEVAGKDWRRALADIRDRSRSGPARVLLASLLHASDRRRAWEILEQLDEPAPRLRSLRFETMARLAAAERQPDRARQFARRALEAFAGNHRARRLWARLLADRDRGLAEIDKVLGDWRRDPLALYALASIRFNRKEYALARTAVEAGLRRDQTRWSRADGESHRATILFALEEYEGARRSWSRMLEIVPEQARRLRLKILYQLADVEALLRKWEDHAARFRRILEIDPGQARAAVALADFYSQLGRRARVQLRAELLDEFKRLHPGETGATDFTVFTRFSERATVIERLRAALRYYDLARQSLESCAARPGLAPWIGTTDKNLSYLRYVLAGVHLRLSDHAAAGAYYALARFGWLDNPLEAEFLALLACHAGKSFREKFGALSVLGRDRTTSRHGARVALLVRLTVEACEEATTRKIELLRKRYNDDKPDGPVLSLYALFKHYAGHPGAQIVPFLTGTIRCYTHAEKDVKTVSGDLQRRLATYRVRMRSAHGSLFALQAGVALALGKKRVARRLFDAGRERAIQLEFALECTADLVAASLMKPAERAAFLTRYSGPQKLQDDAERLGRAGQYERAWATLRRLAEMKGLEPRQRAGLLMNLADSLARWFREVRKKARQLSRQRRADDQKRLRKLAADLLAGSIATYEEILRLGGLDFMNMARSNLGVLYAYVENYRAAARVYEKIEPKHAGVHQSLASWYLKLYTAGGHRSLDDQIADLESYRAHAARPLPLMIRSLHAKRAMRFMNGGRLADAVGELARAHALRPDDPDVNYLLGVALVRTGQKAKATVHLSRARRGNPADPRVHLALARVYRELELPDASRRAYDAFLAHAGAGGKWKAEIAEARRHLAMLVAAHHRHYDRGLGLMRKGDAKDAAAAFEKALAINPNSRMVLEMLGVVRLQLRRPLEALSAFRKILKMDEAQPTALFYAGYICAQLSRDAEARRYFEKFLARHPKSERVPAVKKFLATLK